MSTTKGGPGRIFILFRTRRLYQLPAIIALTILGRQCESGGEGRQQVAYSRGLGVKERASFEVALSRRCLWMEPPEKALVTCSNPSGVGLVVVPVADAAPGAFEPR